MNRISYDITIKHNTRYELLEDILTEKQIAQIPNSNISRWKNESDNKFHCENMKF
ncbi:hypothetical protein [Dokdonia pacifica]|uniref:Uncharacterized protein n=1 Tax=Dokdonia pacifica TaxID=1627892 RepID=A0A239E5P3_9FLAO|nr:hypothetical protein [Dokdonia pacifica]SNS40035.1 hypothetical protein SAMN06265376_11420 [Dokdonia pacifica]